MPALITRQEARERLQKLFEASLERIIPADEKVPLKGEIFRDFENQAEEMRRAILPALLEERAALSPDAVAGVAGRCPHCGSDRIYLRQELQKVEIISPHGPVVLNKQAARCRCCGRSFSPSRANLGVAGGSGADAKGGGAGGKGSGGAAL